MEPVDERCKANALTSKIENRKAKLECTYA